MWNQIRRRAGLDGVRLHDLRHSYASTAVASGDSLYLVGKDGKVGYQGAPGPRGFKPDELEDQLKKLLGKPGSTK